MVLITGGSGTFGQAFAELLLKTEGPAAIRLFARSEHRLVDVAERLHDDRIRKCTGDIRDLDRLKDVMRDVHIVVHAAALKRVEGTQDAEEMLKTNVLGSMNVASAAIERRVERVMGISSDKACQATTLYGATKLAMEQLFLAAHGRSRTTFACVRYGNVIGSTGSVVPVFRARARQRRPLQITDPRCTRFWITINSAVKWVKRRIERMEPGRIYVPKLPSARVLDIAAAVRREYPSPTGGESITTGMRGSIEKLHEQMIGFDESRSARVLEDPETLDCYELGGPITGAPEWVYASDSNPAFLDVKAIGERLAEIPA